MSLLILLGGALGLYLFYPLCRGILKREIVQNPLTFFLWACLDAIAALTAFLEHGNYLQALLFCLGALSVVACAIIARNSLKWTGFETLVTGLVCACIAIWVATTNVWALVASITALLISSVPQMRDTWTKPFETPTLVYFGYMVSNALAALGGKEFSLVEVSYPLSGLFVCTIIWSFSLRKS